MSETTSTTTSGIGFLGLLTILFIGLRLTNLITWSWWWVLAPLWIPVALFTLIIGIGLGLLLWRERN